MYIWLSRYPTVDLMTHHLGHLCSQSLFLKAYSKLPQNIILLWASKEGDHRAGNSTRLRRAQSMVPGLRHSWKDLGALRGSCMWPEEALQGKALMPIARNLRR
mmetsp:Transcript_22909/g.59847  ORF Transcript_22909/g.59847 Transcript_22909/m.59847 type:complete len:103 (+) Transcript_22909:2079-2387(+)